MREIVGHHEGSTLNNSIQILADERDESGGSHAYRIRWGVKANAIYNGEQTIEFQRGPLLVVGLNGISDEALIAVVIDRLEGFNTGKYTCRENALAITKLEEALHWLRHRTLSRQRRGVEGTHQV